MYGRNPVVMAVKLRILSSGILCCVVWKRETSVLEGYATSILRV
jgi:hypothetical protein